MGAHARRGTIGGETSEDSSAPEPRYPAREHHAPKRYGEWVARTAYQEIVEPATYEAALASPQSKQWKNAMDSEYESLIANGTWTLVSNPPGVQPIPTKWVYKVKRDGEGNLDRYKARWVAKGYRQREGIDYDEVFAPVVKYTSFRALAAIAAQHDLELHLLDIKTAFLNGEMDLDVYLEQPKGYEDKDRTLVCKLNKTLYGLKQAPRAWNQKLKAELEKLGFRESAADAGLYIGIRDNHPIYILVYVDDLLIASQDLSVVQGIKETIKKLFDARDLGDAKMFLGIVINRDRPARTIKLTQERLVDDLLTQHNMLDAAPKELPLSPGAVLSKTAGDRLDTSIYPYSSLVGSLLYLSITTRPDIAQAVGALARHMATPTTTHWQAAKGVVRYLQGTKTQGLTFGDASENTVIQGYCDSDYAGDIDTRRSTTGYVFLLYNGAVSWASKRQPTVAASTTEAEYMAAAFAAKEALWLRTLLSDFKIAGDKITINADNQSALKLLYHPISSARSKHIDVAHHFVRERVERGEIDFVYVSTDKQVADMLTKPLPVGKLKFCKAQMGVS